MAGTEGAEEAAKLQAASYTVRCSKIRQRVSGFGGMAGAAATVAALVAMLVALAVW